MLHTYGPISTLAKNPAETGNIAWLLREEDCSSMVRRKEEREEATRRRACAACTSRHCVSVVWKLCANTSRLLHCDLCKQLHSAWVLVAKDSETDKSLPNGVSTNLDLRILVKEQQGRDSSGGKGLVNKSIGSNLHLQCDARSLYCTS